MLDLTPFADLQRQNKSRDEIIGAMNRRGLTISEAIRAARGLFGISLGEAKDLASNHPAYRGVVKAARPLHDDLLQAFEGIAEPRSGSPPVVN